MPSDPPVHPLGSAGGIVYIRADGGGTMTSARASLEGPFTRSVREALESVCAPLRAQQVLAAALTTAGRTTVPEDASPFAAFVQGPLRAAVTDSLGEPSYDVVSERLSHVLLMASSQVLAREPSAPERDDESRVRVTSLPAPGKLPAPGRPSVTVDDDYGFAILDRPRPGAGAHARGRTTVPPQASSDRAVTSRPAPPATVPPATVPPTTVPPTTLSPESARPVAAPVRILLASLDPLLLSETQARFEGRGEVRLVGTRAELFGGLARPGRAAIVVDTALPSIDVPTLASAAASFPPGTLVVLWGMSDRQKLRLVSVFPVSEGWLASGAAASPVDMLAGG
jgi:hypothetical protein